MIIKSYDLIKLDLNKNNQILFYGQNNGAKEEEISNILKIKKNIPDNDIDVVIPIPESSITSGTKVAEHLNKEVIYGFVKNRYVGRTFIMPEQEMRRRSVRRKLNPINES